MSSPAIKIRGAAELEKAFLQVRRDVLRELKPAIVVIAKKVSGEAERLASANISNIGSRWPRMRVGVTLNGAYVAPKSRRLGGSPRPNLAGLLLNKAMRPALEAKQEEALLALDALVNKSSAEAGF